MTASPRKVLVCHHSACGERGAIALFKILQESSLGENITLEATGCQGQCTMGPTVRVLPEEVWYCQVHPADLPQIIEEHLQGGKPVIYKLNPRIHRPWPG